MVEFNNFTAKVEAAGRELVEYPYLDEELPRTKTVYIEVPNTEEPIPFKVTVTPTRPLDYTVTKGETLRLYVDGVRDAYLQIIKENTNADGHVYDSLYVNTDDLTGAIPKELLFKCLETTEDNDDNDTILDLKQVGTIEIVLAQIMDWTYKDESPPLLKAQSSFHEGKVGEKKIKGSSSSHLAGLGKELSGVIRQSKWVYTSSKIFYTIRFIYRSKAALQSLGVIPKDPSPRRLKRKREEVIDLTGPDVHFKREPRVKQERRERKRFQVVDLT